MLRYIIGGLCHSCDPIGLSRQGKDLDGDFCRHCNEPIVEPKLQEAEVIMLVETRVQHIPELGLFLLEERTTMLVIPKETIPTPEEILASVFQVPVHQTSPHTAPTKHVDTALLKHPIGRTKLRDLVGTGVKPTPQPFDSKPSDIEIPEHIQDLLNLCGLRI